MRIKRIFGALLTLVTDDYINYVKVEGGPTYFAYFNKDNIDFTGLLNAINHNIAVNLLIERRQKDKAYDHLTNFETAEQLKSESVVIKTSDTPITDAVTNTCDIFFRLNQSLNGETLYQLQSLTDSPWTNKILKRIKTKYFPKHAKILADGGTINDVFLITSDDNIRKLMPKTYFVESRRYTRVELKCVIKGEHGMFNGNGYCCHVIQDDYIGSTKQSILAIPVKQYPFFILLPVRIEW